MPHLIFQSRFQLLQAVGFVPNDEAYDEISSDILGTYDGSNTEISELAGPENIVFSSSQTRFSRYASSTRIFAQNLLNQNPTLARIVNMLD